jgi:hypothetical protein
MRALKKFPILSVMDRLGELHRLAVLKRARDLVFLPQSFENQCEPVWQVPQAVGGSVERPMKSLDVVAAWHTCLVRSGPEGVWAERLECRLWDLIFTEKRTEDPIAGRLPCAFNKLDFAYACGQSGANCSGVDANSERRMINAIRVAEPAFPRICR